MTTSNPLHRLEQFGQSIWLDSLSRALIRSGQLRSLIGDDGLSGVTSNPTIFEKAIGETSDYDTDISRLSREGKGSQSIYESLAVADIQEAAGLLRPVYEATQGIDGYVSLEVSPFLAHDTQKTIAEAQRLWSAVNRPNVMIKIPATREGVPAISACTAQGINVNVTLLFGLPRYREVAGAYLSGLEQRAAQGADLSGIRSVASFFLSRIDVLIDPQLQGKAPDLKGQVAIASAKIAYMIYREIFDGERFRKLAAQGARKQWLLWGSTGTKSKEYSDVKYVEALVGPETVNTLPVETLEAYRDHGSPERRLDADLESAVTVMNKLSALDIDIDKVTQQLEGEGVDKFAASLTKLLQRVETKSHSPAAA
jgi:transaldolase/transaldolase/glucose-6-phosphate isomerase